MDKRRSRGQASTYGPKERKAVTRASRTSVASVWPTTPLKLTATGFSYAGGSAPYAAWQRHARPQLSGAPLGCILL